ncbi:MAG: hypothetical protein K0R58_3614, partial [Ramlibacter sp.]|nr:hypothetical protein [Ramlibacter sp.]
ARFRAVARRTGIDAAKAAQAARVAAARPRYKNRQLAEKLPDIFTALFEAGTKEKDTAALSLLVNRAVPVRKGVPVNFKTRPLSNPTECAEAFGDILAAIGRGELTPDEGNMIGALIERRANLFQTVELQDEIAALKAQIAGLVVTPPRPALHVVDRASPLGSG